MNLKRNLRKGLAVVFSALMMTSGMNVPIIAAEGAVTNEPSQMHIVYGLGEGKVTVTQNGETTELTSDASGEQKVYTVQGNENEPVEITVEAGTDFNVSVVNRSLIKPHISFISVHNASQYCVLHTFASIHAPTKTGHISFISSDTIIFIPMNKLFNSAFREIFPH